METILVSIRFTECITGKLQFNMTQTPEMTVSPTTFVNFPVQCMNFGNIRNFKIKIKNSELIAKINDSKPSYNKTLLYPLSVKHYHLVNCFPWT